ncbi:MAG: GNAT family N-acetyltransferase [Tistlia sp.]
MSAAIRRLGPDDWQAFRDVRLAGLRREPDNFGAFHEEEADRPEAFWRDWTERATVVGAFGESDALLGLAGIYLLPGRRMRHKAQLFGMYVAEPARGQGLGRRLCEAAIAAAKALPGVTQVQAVVWIENRPACALYRSLGFLQWGLEPCGTRAADGTCCDNARLTLRFD